MQTDRVISIRSVVGVNRVEDARLVDPGAWFTTQNLYGRSPGTLAKRPGTTVLVAPVDVQPSSLAPALVAASHLGAGESLTPLPNTMFTSV